MDLTSFDALVKDMYPRPGDHIKQWVVDTRREHEWSLATCPRFDVTEHNDNTGTSCSNAVRLVPWFELDHHCCHDCGDQHEHLRDSPSVQEWLVEKAKRPPIEQDRSKFSDQIAPDLQMTKNPILQLLRKKA